MVGYNLFWVPHWSMYQESFFLLERADKPWLFWEVLYLLQSQLHGYMVSVLAFSLTYSLKTHSHTRVAILVHEPFRSLCLCNLSLYIILVLIVEYSCNHHCLLMTVWVSCVCPAKNMVAEVLISYVVQWERSTDIQFEVKFISFYFYISYFTGFTSTCIQAPDELPLTFSPIDI